MAAGGDDDVQYDNAAFGYFMLTGLFMYIVPSGIYTLRKLYSAVRSSKADVGSTRSQAEAQLRQRVASEKKSLRNTMRGCFLVNFVFLSIACISAVLLINALQGSEIKSYDPYAVLGLDSGATPKEIKTAYRKLSLLYHPDKNPDDAEAAEKFMELAKAHQTLTDEAARENFEKYGNPDGPQAQRVSIGLPDVLLDKDKAKIVIFLYLLGFVAIAVAVMWFKRSSDKYGKNLMRMTEQKYMMLVMTGLRPARYPEDIFPVAAEFTTALPRRGATDESLPSLEAKLKKLGALQPTSLPEPFLKDCAPSYNAARIALQAYMYRVQSTMAPDTAFMLSRLDQMVQFMMRLCATNIYRDSPADKRWAPACKIVEFCQNVVQAIPDGSAAMMQLPHYDPEFRKFGRTRGRVLKKLTFRSFISMPEEQQRRILEDLSEDEQAEVLAVARSVPQAKMDVTVGIKEQSGKKRVRAAAIRAGKDVITIGVKLTREYGDKSLTKPPTVHAPFFPEVKQENWWVVALLAPVKLKKTKLELTEAQLRTVYVGRITQQELEVEATSIQFMAPPVPGVYEVTTRLKCDSYSGIDLEEVSRFAIVYPEPQAQDDDGHGHSHAGGHGHSHDGVHSHSHSHGRAQVAGGGPAGLSESQMRRRMARKRRKAAQQAEQGTQAEQDGERDDDEGGAPTSERTGTPASGSQHGRDHDGDDDQDGKQQGDDGVESDEDDGFFAIAYEDPTSDEEEPDFDEMQPPADDGGLADVLQAQSH